MSVTSAAHSGREAARLMAVQALYQMDIAEAPLEKVIEEFKLIDLPSRLRPKRGMLPFRMQIANISALLRGVIDEQRHIDKAINDLLREGWVLKRLDRTLRAIMRAGTFELMFCKDIPVKVCIAEYTSMANAYFNAPEAGMANAILKKL